ncbi:MAG: cytochrome C oxidase subunit IV family protein [Cytophagales bacterium]|nr:cytochrome C oxidase subunit IV family protein [Cytophaga sp.]
MEHGHHSSGHSAEIQPRDPEKVKQILKVTLYLALLTGVEFIMAFTMPRGAILTIGFVLLTFVKTFYIVGEFMHLKHETKILIWAIVLPTMFIMWLIGALLMESNYILDSIRSIFGILAS